MLRPDYSRAKTIFLDLAIKYLKGKKDISLVDFCSGTGADTKLIADHLEIGNAMLLDINEEFLEIAKRSNIQAKVVTKTGDVLSHNYLPSADAVISMFAYHHVSDDRKALYVQKAKDALKPGGILILGEIYMPDKKTTLDYYKQLYASIPQKSEELESFLMQTARSEDFEYKVSRVFAENQFAAGGFTLLESRKVWPKDGSDTGTFIEIWRS